MTIKSSLKKITTVQAWQEAQDEAKKILGCGVPGGCGIDFVAYLMDCGKDEGCGEWVAYAYINWNVSVYVNRKANPVINYGESFYLRIQRLLRLLLFIIVALFTGEMPAVVSHELGVSHIVYFEQIFPCSIESFAYN